MRDFVSKIIFSRLYAYLFLLFGLSLLLPLNYLRASGGSSSEFDSIFKKERDRRDRVVKMSQEKYEKECRKDWEEYFKDLLKRLTKKQIADRYRETLRENFPEEFKKKWEEIRKVSGEPTKEEVLSDYKKEIIKLKTKLAGMSDEELFSEYIKNEREKYLRGKLYEKRNLEYLSRLNVIINKPWMSMKGKVVDQNNDPAADANLTFINYGGARDMIMSTEFKGSSKLTIKTNGLGEFTLKNLPGDSIELLNMECSGCRWLKEKDHSILYVPYIDKYYSENYPDFQKPNSNPNDNVKGEFYIRKTGAGRTLYYYDSNKHEIVFKLYKEEFKGSPELFEIYETYINVFLDKTPAVYDVFKDNKLVYPDPNTALDELDGDLLLETGYNSDNKRDVFLKLTSIGGGIVETAYSELPYNAPQEGYQKSYVMNLIERKGGGDLRKKIFVRSRNGKVHMKLTLSANTSKYKGKEYVKLTIEGLVNPMGSRNLEPSGKRYKANFNRALAERDWSRDDYDDLKDKLEEKQAGQIKTIENTAMCQVKFDNKYWLGYFGNNGVFYRFKGSGSDEKHETVKLAAAEKLVEFDRPKTVKYCLNKEIYKYNYKMCSVLTAERVVLIYPVIVESDERYRGADHLQIPDAWLSKLKKENYKLVNVKKTE